MLSLFLSFSFSFSFSFFFFFPFPGGSCTSTVRSGSQIAQRLTRVSGTTLGCHGEAGTVTGGSISMETPQTEGKACQWAAPFQVEGHWCLARTRTRGARASTPWSPSWGPSASSTSGTEFWTHSKSRSWPAPAQGKTSEATSWPGLTSSMEWWGESRLTPTASSVLVRDRSRISLHLPSPNLNHRRRGHETDIKSVSRENVNPLHSPTSWHLCLSDCPQLENAVPHLRASSPAVSPGSQTQLSCVPGFYLVGEPLLQCHNKGEWSHALPRCEREGPLVTHAQTLTLYTHTSTHEH
uniref:Sushi domain-containing protein n=1 Tax=Hucho hucho TaxID=62062 RepID=A0A4W5M1Q4_9TELE